MSPYQRTLIQRAALLGATLLGACRSLPPAPPDTAHAAMEQVRNESTTRLWVTPGWAPSTIPAPSLGRVSVIRTAGLGADEDRTQDALRTPLEAAFASAPDNPLRLDITLSEIHPVSPTLNVLSTLIVLMPLDTGSLQLKAVVRDANGKPVAELDEQLSGQLLDVGKSFDAYAHLHAALEQWAERCAQWPSCFLPTITK